MWFLVDGVYIRGPSRWLLNKELPLEVTLLNLEGLIVQSRSGANHVLHDRDYLETIPLLWDKIAAFNKNPNKAVAFYTNSSKLNKTGIESFFKHNHADYPVVLSKHPESTLLKKYDLNNKDVNWRYLTKFSNVDYIPKIEPGPQIILIMGPPHSNKHLVAQKTGLTVLDMNVYNRDQLVQNTKQLLHATPPEAVVIVGRNASETDRQPFIALARAERVPISIWWSLGGRRVWNEKNNYDLTNISRDYYQNRFDDPEANNSGVPVIKVLVS